MQVILGAGGAIGTPLAKELKNYTNKIRLVGRNPVKVNNDDELFAADLLKADETDKAIEGADVAYLTIGLPYRIKTWQVHWPIIMDNVINACKKHNTRLVFFDNIYMYDKNQLSPMTEETPVNPPSGKGRVRAKIAGKLLEEMHAGNIKALIARAADFYGPGINNSLLNETVVKNFKNGKKGNWFCSIDHLHNFTYTPDAAKATALLGNSENAFGEVWHLPTIAPITMKKWIELFAHEFNTAPKVMVVPKFMVALMGFINPIMKEMAEMLYQYDRNYNFNSSKFETAFNLKPTPIEEGIKQVV
ncbi:MAG TPA: NAD-dependent epimerase/dehydratase family protein, partial [Prolixibacteraceae bacterium]|nr:NAD-dependent epimerase/dehydratase family protein [Prolixibacteraceae bacterium]